MRSTILHIEHESGLRLGSPQVLHDGHEHRIVRFFVEDHKRRDLSVRAWRGFSSGAVVVTAYVDGRETRDSLEVRVAVPERMFDKDGGYFISAYLEGPCVSVIVAAKNAGALASDRPQREGNDITAEVLIP